MECACYSRGVHDPLQGAQPPQGPAQHYDPNLAAGPHFGAAPLTPQHDGWGKIGIVMVAMAVLFAGGVAYFIATSGSSKGDKTESAAVAATAGDAGAAGVEVANTANESDAAAAAEADPVEATEPTPTPAAEDAGAAAIETDPEEVGGQIGLLRANGEVDRPAGLVSLAIESEPAGATVIRKRDGVRLGTTPYRYEVERSRADVGFILNLEGYRSMSVSMPGDKDGVRQVMLLPGSGGVPIPAPSTDEPVKPPTTDAPKNEVVAKDVPKKPKPTNVLKPKKPRPTNVSKPKKPAKPKRPSKPSKPKPPKKPKGGKVDYQADPIPL